MVVKVIYSKRGFHYFYATHETTYRNVQIHFYLDLLIIHMQASVIGCTSLYTQVALCMLLCTPLFFINAIFSVSCVY